MQNALNLPYSGYRSSNNGNLNDVSTNAYYWSTTPINLAVNFLNFYSNDVSPDFYDARSHGLNIRCIKN